MPSDKRDPKTSRADPDGSPQARPAPVRPIFFKLCLSLGAVFFALLLVEIGFRVYYWSGDIPTVITYGDDDEARRKAWIARHRGDAAEDPWMQALDYHPRLGWTLKPNLRNVSFSDTPPFSTNSKGVRGTREIPYDPPPDVQRIVLIGDSYAFGLEEVDEFAWGVQLEARLAACEVVNLGVPAYGVDQQLLMLQEEGVKYHPDVVVVGVYPEDAIRSGLVFREYAKPLFVLEDDGLVLTNVPVPTAEEILAADEGGRPISYAFHFLQNRVGVLYGSFTPRDEAYSDYLMDLNRAILRRVNTVAQDAGARVLFVIIPEGIGRKPGRFEKLFALWAAEMNAELLNLRDALTEAQEREKRPVFAGHFSRFGNYVAAEAVAERLLELGWAKPLDDALLAERIESLRQGLEAAAGDVRTQIATANLLHAQGRIDEAVTMLRDAVAREPGNSYGRSRLGTALMASGEYSEALQELRIAVALRPAEPKFRSNLGDALLRLGKLRGSNEALDKAVKQYRTVLTLRPEAPDVHVKIGAALMLQGKMAEAIEVLKEAVRREPERADARLSLGEALLQTDQPVRAVKVLEEFVQQEPNSALGFAQLAAALYRCNRFADGVKALRRGLAVAPKDVQLTGTLAWYLATCSDEAVRDGTEALRLAKKICRTPTAAAFDCLAAAHAELGDFVAAIEAAERALRMAGDASNQYLIDAIQSRITSYREGKPYHETP